MPHQAKEISILIVEDDLVIAGDLSSLLRSNGYHVVGIATSHKKAIHLLHRNKIHLAILDISMDTMDTGIEIAKHINTQFDIPFIFLTSYSDKETLESATKEKPFGYLVKPYQEATLLSTVSLALSNHESFRNQPNLSKVNKVLTKTELSVCELLCTSLTFHEIADRLFISKNTVKFHVKNIYFKLDLHKRSELLHYLCS